MILFCALIISGEPVCIHCKDSIPGCAGGDACPLVTEVAANGQIFENNNWGVTPTIVHLLPPELLSHFPKSVCDAIVSAKS